MSVRPSAGPGGVVEAINLAEKSSGPTFAVEEVVVVPGKGIEGDRIVNEADGDVAPHKQVTLIEAEALEAVNRDYGMGFSAAESRRNICTRGVALDHLVDRAFRVGEATLEGVELCEPCGLIEKLSGKNGVRKALVHRGGLRARVVDGGKIRTGDAVSAV